MEHGNESMIILAKIEKSEETVGVKETDWSDVS